MAYDSSKDKTLASAVACEGKAGRITVSVCQYNGGDKKIQISRDLPGDKFAKLGRMTIEEMDAVIKAYPAVLAQANSPE
jgi:hypothetical protein